MIQRIEKLTQLKPTSRWALGTLQLFEILQNSESIGDAGNAVTLGQIEGQLVPLGEIMQSVFERRYSSPSNPNEMLATDLMRLKYSIQRQLAVWKAVHQLAREDLNAINQTLETRNDLFMQASSKRIRFNISPDWEKYLMTEEVESVLNGLHVKPSKKRAATRKTLARMYSPVLAPAQVRHIFSNEFSPETVSFLKAGATQALDLERLLTRLENFEATQSGVAQYQLNDHYQNMLWSDIPACQNVVTALDTHYRNANFRLEVSDRLINRLVPELPTTTQPLPKHHGR